MNARATDAGPRKNGQPRAVAWLVLPVFLGCAVIGMGIVRGENSVQGFYELKRSRDVLAGSVDLLKKENSGLSDEIQRIKKSPTYARKVLRDKYHVTDEGEDIVFFPE